MNHTTNYDLPQWEDSDVVRRADVNSAMNSIDAAIKAAADAAAGGVKAAVGSYVGTGTKGAGNPNSITFGFVPKLVILFPGIGSGARLPAMTGSTFYVPAFILWGTTGSIGSDSGSVTYNGTTMTWYNSSEDRQYNNSGYTYYYLAIG